MYKPEDRHGFETPQRTETSTTFYTYNPSETIRKLRQENEDLQELIKAEQAKNEALKSEIDMLKARIGDESIELGLNYIDGHWCNAIVENIKGIQVDTINNTEYAVKCKGDVVYRDVDTNEKIAVRHLKKSSGGK